MNGAGIAVGTFWPESNLIGSVADMKTSTLDRGNDSEFGEVSAGREKQSASVRLEILKADSSDGDVSTLETLEYQIDRSLTVVAAGGIAMGAALAEIRRRGLYREGYATFDQYCEVRWKCGRSQRYRLIDAALLYEDLKIRGFDVLPQTERQARRILSRPSEARAGIWGKIVQVATQANQGRLPIPVAVLSDAVDSEIPERAKKGKRKPNAKVLEILDDFERRLPGDVTSSVAALLQDIRRALGAPERQSEATKPEGVV